MQVHELVIVHGGRGIQRVEFDRLTMSLGWLWLILR